MGSPILKQYRRIWPLGFQLSLRKRGRPCFLLCLVPHLLLLGCVYLHLYGFVWHAICRFFPQVSCLWVYTHLYFEIVLLAGWCTKSLNLIGQVELDAHNGLEFLGACRWGRHGERRELYSVTAPPSHPSGLFFPPCEVGGAGSGLHSRTSQAGFAQGQPISLVLSGKLATQRSASCRLNRAAGFVRPL